jgi:Lon-like ATP-dependent protease
MAKIEAAVEAGAKRVIIPVENMQETLKHYDKAEIIPVESLHQVLKLALYPEETKNKNEEHASFSDLLLNRTLSAHSAETGVEKQG